MSEGPASPAIPAADDGSATLRAYTDATREIMRVVAESRHDEQPVFQAIVKSASRLCNSWRTTLALVDDAKENIVNRAGWLDGEPDRFTGVSLPLVDQGIAPLAIRERRLVHETNIADSELYRNGHKNRRHLVDELGVQTLLTVPIYAGTEVIGCINLMRQEPDPFSDQQILLLETFADQAVIAIENARQFRELQTRLDGHVQVQENQGEPSVLQGAHRLGTARHPDHVAALGEAGQVGHRAGDGGQSRTVAVGRLDGLAGPRHRAPWSGPTR